MGKLASVALLLMPGMCNAQGSLVGKIQGGSFATAEKQRVERMAVGDDFRSSSAALPHLAIGGAWKTILVATNVSSSLAKVEMDVYDPSGNRMVIPLRRADSGQVTTGDSFTLTLAEGASMTLIAEGGAITKTGWIWYDYVSKYTDPNYGGYVAIQEVFRASIPGRPDLEAVVLPDWALDKKIIAPFDNTSGFRTAIALANANPYDRQSLIITIRDESGAVVNTRYENLQIGEQRAFQTDEVWLETQGRRGTITIMTNEYRLASLSLIFNPSGAMTTSQFYSVD